MKRNIVLALLGLSWIVYAFQFYIDPRREDSLFAGIFGLAFMDVISAVFCMTGIACIVSMILFLLRRFVIARILAMVCLGLYILWGIFSLVVMITASQALYAFILVLIVLLASALLFHRFYISK